jgi:hypothetical protein
MFPVFTFGRMSTRADDELTGRIADGPAPFWRHVRDGAGRATSVTPRRPSSNLPGFASATAPQTLPLRTLQVGRDDARP